MEVARIANGRLDAHARRADEDDRLDVSSAQRGFEVGFVEAAVPRLVEDDVVGLRSEVVDDVGVPRVANEDPARAPVAVTASPARSGSCLIQVGESGNPASARSALNAILR